MFCYPLKYEDTRSKAILNAIKDHYLSESLFDVRIICRNQEEVCAHRLLLSGVSGFFETYFRTTGNFPHTRNAGHQIAVLDFGQYDADDLKVILSWLYTGELPDHDILAERIFDIFIITDFLLVGVLKADCYNFMRKEVLFKAASDPEYAMDAYRLGKLLADPEIISIAQEGFLRVRSLPSDFLSIDLETMKHYLKRFDECPLNEVWRADLITLEMFLVNLVSSYINFDKKNRLKDATELFFLLKIILVQDLLDFKALNLEELENMDEFPDLHFFLNECKIFDDVNLGGLPPIYRDKWLPRKDSIKYSFWTGNRGNFLTSKSSKNTKKYIEYMKGLKQHFGRNPSDMFLLESLEKSSKEMVTKKFALENSRAYLVGIDTFTTVSGARHPYVSGIRFRWSDNTFQLAGNDDGVCNAVSFYPPRTASVSVWIASKMFLTAIQIITWIPTGGRVRASLETHGPFGYPTGPMREVFSSNKLLEKKAYLDGVRGCEVKIGNRKILSGLSFKMSFFVNYPLSQLTGEHVNAEPCNPTVDGHLFAPTTLKILKVPVHQIKVHEFRQVARAAIKNCEWHYSFCSDPNINETHPRGCCCSF